MNDLIANFNITNLPSQRAIRKDNRHYRNMYIAVEFNGEEDPEDEEVCEMKQVREKDKVVLLVVFLWLLRILILIAMFSQTWKNISSYTRHRYWTETSENSHAAKF